MPELIQLENESVLTPVALIDSDGLVVLFHSATAGTVIQSDGSYPIGHHSPEWYMGNLEPKPCWKQFHGTATLNFI